MGPRRCRECGAQLRLRSTSCPLCGSEEENSGSSRPPKKKPSVASVDDYQSDIRKLREELRRLRDAEAS
jgi:predicted amidophosphoribosyltransferase